MGSCNIDHTQDEVKQKLSEQKPFLPTNVADQLAQALTVDVTQESLNDIFHLLKKYDLATEDEQKEREQKLAVYF